MRNDEKEPFSALGLASTASALEVKKAYRRLVAQWHPDRFGLEPARQQLAQERLKEINAAYDSCLKLIGQRRRSFWGISVVDAESPPQAAARPPAQPPSPPERTAAPNGPPLAAWPNGALAAVLVAGWLVGLKRYGLGGDFLQFMGLLALMPAIAAVWYNARLLQGRLMLLLYVAVIACAGLFLLVSQALDEQQLQVAVPGWQGGGEGIHEAFGGGRRDRRGFSLAPSAATERSMGPMAPLVPEPAAPTVPQAPLAPAAPLAPRAR